MTETHDKRTETHACDLISRQAAIDAVHEEFDECLVWDESGQRTADEFEIIINRLPSAQRWIPCKERMPKPKEYENDVLKYYLVQNEFGDMMVCSWDGKYWEQMYQYKNVRDKVVAWMPLPKPWKGEEK